MSPRIRAAALVLALTATLGACNKGSDNTDKSAQPITDDESTSQGLQTIAGDPVPPGNSSGASAPTVTTTVTAGEGSSSGGSRSDGSGAGTSGSSSAGSKGSGSKGTNDSSSSSSGGSSSASSGDWVATTNGFGPIRMGGSAKEMERQGLLSGGKACAPGPAFRRYSARGAIVDTLDDRVYLIQLAPGQRTRKGIQLGSSEEQLTSTYGSEVKLDGTSEGIGAWSLNWPDGRSLQFETQGGKVTRITIMGNASDTGGPGEGPGCF